MVDILHLSGYLESNSYGKSQYLVCGSHLCCDGGHSGLSENYMYYMSGSDFGLGTLNGKIGPNCRHGIPSFILS